MSTDQQPLALVGYTWRGPWDPRAYAEPGSPGFGGYALAVVISLVTLALEVGIADVIQNGATISTEGGMLLVLVFGFLPAAVIGSIGAVLVHFATRDSSSQWPAVLVAMAIGLGFGLVANGPFPSSPSP
jgi:hypothetical protein